MSALKDLLISILVTIAFGLIIGTSLWYFGDWPFKAAFWTGYTVGILFDITCMFIGIFLRWLKGRRDRIYLTGNSRYGKH